MNKQLILELYEIGCIKFGHYTLKSGILSPIYIDLRLIVSYPLLLKKVAQAFWQKVQNLNFQRVCGVPYTALPIATAISLEHNIPMVMRRKEAKDYGTKKLIEGVFASGDRCLVIEDLITSGKSVLETIEPLQAVGLQCGDAAVLLDRQQGGSRILEHAGFRLHSVFTIADLLEVLVEARALDDQKVKEIEAFIAANQVSS